MEKEAIDATIDCRTVTQQIEEGTPWVAAISANMDIASKEPIVTDLTLKQVPTSPEGGHNYFKSHAVQASKVSP